MKSFILVTVQHTGTNAFRNHAESIGYRDQKLISARKIGERRIEPEGVAYWAHSFHFPNGNPKKSLFYVTMIRDPRDVAASWLRRYGTTNDNRDWRATGSLWGQYKRWFEMDFDVTVKVEDPKEGFDKLSELTGVDFGATLKPANIGPKGKVNMDDPRLDDLLTNPVFESYQCR